MCKSVSLRMAKQEDYHNIIKYLQNLKGCESYINEQYIINDIINQNLYVVCDENNDVIAISSLLFDQIYNMYYIKRLAIINTAYIGIGISKLIIKTLIELVPVGNKIAITPWRTNEKMINLVTKSGFVFNYIFNEKYMLYTLSK